MNLATDEKADHETPRVGPGNAKLGGTDIFRGALVIVTALIIGGFVISRGLGNSPENETTAPNTSIVDISGDGDGTGDVVTDTTAGLGSIDDGVLNPEATPTTADTTPDTAPAAPALRAPAEVKVLVLNAAQSQGIAGRGTEALLAANYKTGAPKNADERGPSAVLFAEGYDAEALAVAAVFGEGVEELVQPLDLANLPIADIQDSNIVVVLGPDQLIPLP